MKQKKMFKRRQERHPVKRTLIISGLVALSFVSFSAGVQFAELSQDAPKVRYADTDGQPSIESDVGVPLKISHSPGRNI